MSPGNSSGSYDEKCPWAYASPSSRTGNFTSQLPTIFCIKNPNLNFEIREFCLKAELLDDAGVLACSELALLFALGARHDHLAAGKYQRRCFRLPYAHDDGCEPLGVVLCVAGVQRYGFEIQPALEVDGGYYVPASGVRTAASGLCLTWWSGWAAVFRLGMERELSLRS